MVQITRGGQNRSALRPNKLVALAPLSNDVNNFLVNGSTHALPPAKDGRDFAVSILPGESSTVSTIGLLDNIGNATIMLIAYHWIGGVPVPYE